MIFSIFVWAFRRLIINLPEERRQMAWIKFEAFIKEVWPDEIVTNGREVALKYNKGMANRL